MRWPALVRFAEDGRLLGFSFDPGAPAKARRFLISLFALSHQFVTRADPAPWSVSGLRDENGPFSARFEWRDPDLLAGDHDLVLHRQVLAYEGGAPSAGGGAVSVARSDGEARLSEGWIDHVAAREERRGSLADVLDIVSEARLRVQRTSMDTVTIDPSDLPEGGITWEVSIAADPDTESEPIDAEDTPSGPPLELLEGHLAGLRDVVGTDEVDGDAVLKRWQDIAALIKRSPREVIPALLQQLRSGALAGDSAGWALSAMGGAGGEGCPEAVAALGDLLRDPAVHEDARLAALVASQQLGEYGGPLLDAALDVLLTSDTLSEDSPLPAAAALLLGQLAGLEGLPAENREVALGTIDAVRDWAFSNAQAAVYFEALGNSGDPALIATAFDYLEHPDEVVRRASSELLRQLEQDPRAIEALLGKAGSGDHASVRLAAIDSLANMGPTPETTSALAALAAGDADEAVRAGAVSALGSLAGAGVDDAWRAIERAASDANPDVRQIASDLLNDRATGSAS
jgi:HEAT repeat protein